MICDNSNLKILIRIELRLMNFEIIAARLNALVSQKQPQSINSSWILKHAPECYRYIQKNIRTEWDTIDWDRVTSGLDWKYQRLWKPKRRPKILNLYRDIDEVNLIIKNFQNKLYIFIAPADNADLRLRDYISIRLVRLSQRGNILAKQEIMKLVQHAVDEWMDNSQFMSRWKGNYENIQEIVDGCIRRYRYSGSFIKYLHRTLQCAARSIEHFYTYSLDEPVSINVNKLKIENVIRDPETGEIRLFCI
jgi:hypothetical protein